MFCAEGSRSTQVDQTPPRSLRERPSPEREGGLTIDGDAALGDEPRTARLCYQNEPAEVAMFLRRIAVLIGLFFAVVASQLPEYAQQYRQRLGGAIDELNALIARFDAEAAQSGMNEEQGIAHLQQSD